MPNSYPVAVPPSVPIVTFFDPNKRDRGLVIYINTESTSYQAIDLGTPHENTRDYPGFTLGLQQAVPGNEKWIKRVYTTPETNPDWWNYELKFAAEANAFPTFIRQYREDKKTYTTKTKAQPLTSVYKLVLTLAGTGYTPGTFPAVTFTGGAGSGASGHAIVNLDGTISDLVIDDGGTGYTSAPTATVDDPPIGITATGTAFIQPTSAILVAEHAELFPEDSEFFGLYFNVTRVYETMPGPTLTSTKLDEKDGVLVTMQTTRDLCSNIATTETLIGGVWTKITKKETEIQAICERVVSVRAIPGFPMVSTKEDDDGKIITQTQTYVASSAIVSGETLIGGVWTRKWEQDVDGTTLVSWQFSATRDIPGPLQLGDQTGKWGVEPVQKQKLGLAYGVVDEGYLVRESKIEPIAGSNLVGQKVTIFYPGGLYGVALPGQDYDPRLDTVIPYVNKLQPISYGIGVNREDITPEDYEHANVRTIDPAIVQAVLSAYVFSYPGRINVDMPDVLTAVYGFIDSSTSYGADQEVGSSSLSGSGSIAQTLTGQSQASANILPEAYPVIKQFWGNNIACAHYHFFLPNPVTLADVITKLQTIIGDTVSNWPKFNPELVTLVMTGGRVSVQAKAHSQGSYATSGSGTSSTAGGGTGYSEERGLTIKTLRISPTIHDILTVYDDTYGTESVTATAYAQAYGLGPLESQSTGPISISASITPTTIPATQGETAWPISGLFLYRTDPHPYRYGYIEFHCVIVDATDFPNVP